MEDEFKRVPLSMEQKRIWALSVMHRRSTWTQLIYKRFRGEIEKGELLEIIRTFLQTQEQLKSNFVLEWPSVVQVIPISNDPHKYYYEYDFSAEEDREKLLTDHLAALQHRSFRIDKEPLYQFVLIKMGKEDIVIAQVFHHLIFDASSLPLFWEQLSKISSHTRVQVKPYRDYSVKQSEMDFQEDRQYWQNHLFHFKELPCDLLKSKNASKQSNEIAVYEIKLVHGFIQAVNHYALQYRVAPLTVYLAALFVLIYQYTGVKDLCLGTFFSGRSGSVYKNTIGLFMRILPIRHIVDTNDSLLDIVAGLNCTLLEVYRHQDYSLSQIFDDLHVKHSMKDHPLFSIVFNRMVTRNPPHGYALGPLTECPFQTDVKSTDYSAYSPFQLSFLLNESEETSYLTLWYRTNCYSADDIQSIMGNYLRSVKAIIA